MKLTINHVCAAALTAALAGCTTSPVTDTEASQVQPLRAMSGDSQMIVTRDSGLVGAGSDARVMLDGVRVASLRPSQQVRLSVPAGYHQIGVAMFDDADLRSVVELDLRAGETRRYRVAILTDQMTIMPDR